MGGVFCIHLKRLGFYAKIAMEGEERRVLMSTLHETWREEGYIIVRQLYSPERVSWLRQACERILNQWRVLSPETGRPGGDPESTSMRHLNHSAYFQNDPNGLREMLASIADPKVLALCRGLFGAEPLFRCTSLFMNPTTQSLDGNWHRDSQFLFPDETIEREKLVAANGISDHIQLQVALVPSDDIEFVPGSHRRWDTPEEYHVRRADEGANNRSEMPNALRVALEPGDAVGFNAYGLHRGRYHSDRLRRTFMLTFTDSRVPLSDYFSRQPWFQEPDYLAGLNETQRCLFETFVAAYAKDWEAVDLHV